MQTKGFAEDIEAGVHLSPGLVLGAQRLKKPLMRAGAEQVDKSTYLECRKP